MQKLMQKLKRLNFSIGRQFNDYRDQEVAEAIDTLLEIIELQNQRIEKLEKQNGSK